jgi:hypothetical protein
VTQRRSYFHRRFSRTSAALWLVDDLYFGDWLDEEQAQGGPPLTLDTPEFVHYRDWLLANAIKQGRGNKMRRALIRAEQKYNRLKREHHGTGRLRRNYPARWR